MKKLHKLFLLFLVPIVTLSRYFETEGHKKNRRT